MTYRSWHRYAAALHPGSVVEAFSASISPWKGWQAALRRNLVELERLSDRQIAPPSFSRALSNPFYALLHCQIFCFCGICCITQCNAKSMRTSWMLSKHDFYPRTPFSVQGFPRRKPSMVFCVQRMSIFSKYPDIHVDSQCRFYVSFLGVSVDDRVVIGCIYDS